MFPPRDCDACPVGVVFLRSHFTDNARVSDVSSFVKGDAVIPDHLEGVRSLYSIFLHTLVFISNTLAQALKLVCIGDIPRVFVFWMASQLTEL